MIREYDSLRHIADVEHPFQVPEGMRVIGIYDGVPVAVDNLDVYYVHKDGQWHLEDVN